MFKGKRENLKKLGSYSVNILPVICMRVKGSMTLDVCRLMAMTVFLHVIGGVLLYLTCCYASHLFTRPTSFPDQSKTQFEVL